MPAGETGGQRHGPGIQGLAASWLPSPAAMRAALGVLGVLDARPEPVFDGLAELAAATVGVPAAEIVLTLRTGPARKAAFGLPVAADDAPPAEPLERRPVVVARAPIEL